MDLMLIIRDMHRTVEENSNPRLPPIMFCGYQLYHACGFTEVVSIDDLCQFRDSSPRADMLDIPELQCYLNQLTVVLFVVSFGWSSK